MNKQIEERFANQQKDWDFTTVIDGEVFSNKELKESFEKEIEASDAKLREQETEEKTANPPAEPEEVTEILEEEYGASDDPTNKEFIGLEDFNSWYLSNKDEFSEAQRQPLDSIVAAQEVIGKGCSCKRRQRAEAAQGYYKQALLANYDLENDLIPAILKATGRDRIEFKLNGESFIVHPK